MVGTADWSVGVGVLVYIIAIIVSIILFLKNKKYSQIAFVASVTTYVFAVFYSWDVFEFSKNIVLAILGVSTVLMLLVGTYFAKFGSKGK